MKQKLKEVIKTGLAIIGFVIIIIFSYPVRWYLTIAKYFRGEYREN